MHGLGPLPRDAFSVGFPSCPGLTSLIYSTSLAWAGQDEMGRMLPWHTWRGQRCRQQDHGHSLASSIAIPRVFEALSLDTFEQLLIIFVQGVINYKG